MPEGRNWLRNLRVERVALVDAGANPKADVVMWKRLAKANPDMGDVHQLTTPQTRDAMTTHLSSAHGVTTPTGNPFARHATAHSNDEYASGQEHTHTSKVLEKLLDEPYWKRQFSSDQRQQMADAGTAMSDGSFPIANASDLKNAIQAYGRASDKAAAKAHIIKRAKALGLTAQLPDDWNVSKAEAFASLTIKSEDGTNMTVTPAGSVYSGAINTTNTANVTFTRNTLEKTGRKISSRRLKELMASRDTLNAVIEEAQVEPATKRKEDRMPENENVALDDEARNALPEEAQKFISSLEDKVEKAAEATKTAVEEALAKAKDPDPDEEVFKGMSAEVRKRFEDMEKRASDAEEIAKAEREKRENAEVAKRLETAKAAGIDPAEWAPKLRKIAETDSEFAAKVEETLNAAAERVRTGDLFSELGKSSGEFGASTAFGKLDAMASEIAKAEGIDHAAAVVKAGATPEGARLYAEGVRESERGS